MGSQQSTLDVWREHVAFFRDRANEQREWLEYLEAEHERAKANLAAEEERLRRLCPNCRAPTQHGTAPPCPPGGGRGGQDTEKPE